MADVVRGVGVTMNVDEYFRTIERMTVAVDKPLFYLWPNTWLDDIQTRISMMVGVPDTEPDDERSRPFRIVRYLREHTFENILDICCGDALVLSAIKRKFPEAHCYGVDLNIGAVPHQEEAIEHGVQLYRGAMQTLMLFDPPERFDITMMLNSFRSWENAELSRRQRFLPFQMFEWLVDNSHYSILTINRQQKQKFNRCGYDMVDLGPGEQDSRLVVVDWGNGTIEKTKQGPIGT